MTSYDIVVRWVLVWHTSDIAYVMQYGAMCAQYELTNIVIDGLNTLAEGVLASLLSYGLIIKPLRMVYCYRRPPASDFEPQPCCLGGGKTLVEYMI